MSSGIVSLTKDDANLVGISIGGGAPLCPHVYIVQVFDNTPAALDQTLESGDRIVAVNNADVMGRTKLEVARMIQNAGVSQFNICMLASTRCGHFSKNRMSHTFGRDTLVLILARKFYHHFSFYIENGEYPVREIKL